MSTRLERRVVAKTVNYTVNPALDRPGTTFTNRGTLGAVTFTLPRATRALNGWWYRFKGLVASNISVAAGAGNTLVALNNAAANSVSAITAGMLIGAEIEAFCDGTSWYVSGVSVGHTFTVG